MFITPTACNCINGATNYHFVSPNIQKLNPIKLNANLIKFDISLHFILTNTFFTTTITSGLIRKGITTTVKKKSNKKCKTNINKQSEHHLIKIGANYLLMPTPCLIKAFNRRVGMRIVVIICRRFFLYNLIT